MNEAYEKMMVDRAGAIRKTKLDPTVKDSMCDDIESELFNFKLIRCSMIDECEGGLTFDFEKDGIVKRLVLGYTELGEWIEFLGIVSPITSA